MPCEQPLAGQGLEGSVKGVEMTCCLSLSAGHTPEIINVAE